MTGKERIIRILNHQPVDRIGLFEHYWADTYTRWRSEGHMGENQLPDDIFDYDMNEFWAFQYIIDMDFVPQVIAEDEDTITIKDHNYATLRRHKHHDATPEHIDYDIYDKESWDKVKHLLKPERRRINFEGYRAAKKKCAEQQRFFAWSGINVFECMHPVCGHENLLIGMALEPEWIKEMAMAYADLTIELWKMLFEEEGLPDGIWFFEDMGFKDHPFMSPEMYRELIMPAHKKTMDYAHSLGLPVFMHSCGFIEPLIPHMIEAGVNCLQAMEVKAGMDLIRIYENYGDKIALMGGIDVRTICSNDKAIIDRELEAKIPTVMKKYGYVLHSDHSIPKTVDFESYQYFIKKGLELGTYHDFKE